MTKTASITITIDLDDTITVSASAAAGGTEQDRIYAERLAIGIRALVLKDERTILRATEIYELAKNDISPAPVATNAIKQIIRERDLEKLMHAVHDPSDQVH